MLETGTETPISVFLLKGRPHCHARLFLGVLAKHWALGYVVLRVCNGHWANQRKRRVLAAHRTFPSGTPNPGGAAWDGQDPNECLSK